MVDPKVLAAAGYTDKGLMALFLPEGGDPARTDGVKELMDLTAARIREGVNRNLINGKWFWSIDQACDLSQKQISPTLVQSMISGKMGLRDTQTLLSGLGLSHLITQEIDNKTGQPKVNQRNEVQYKIDWPIFNNVLVPLCMQYVKIRWATLVNDRDTSPFLKYSPLVYSRRGHLKTSILTSRGERMVHDMGYRADFRQEVLMMLKYGLCMSFPQEPYYREVQSRYNEKDLEDHVVVREGIRYAYPHPSRCFYDLGHRLLSVNTNTGMQYAGYWDVYRYGEIIQNGRYWLTEQERKDSTYLGGMKWIESNAWDIYQRLFPCTVAMPSVVVNSQTRSDSDRLAEAFRYNYSNRDNGVVVSRVFQWINPKQYGLFNYDQRIWFCFEMANDSTPLRVEPYCYNPVRVCAYDADQTLWRITSMVQDIMPFQDHLGNLLTQYLISVRRNLINLMYFNKDSVDPNDIERLYAMGAGAYTGLNLVPVSFKEASYDSTSANVADQFKAVHFPVVDTSGHITAINTLLGIVERVIGFTSQEIGASGSHVQTAEEIRVIKTFSNARISLTDSFIDSSVAAWKVQLYEALMAYGSDEVMAQLADLMQVDRAALEEMGFTVEDGPNRTAGVIGPKSALTVTAFSSDREGSRRNNDAQIATAMLQFAQTVLSVPQVVEGIGIPRIVEMFNTIGQFAGMSPEMRIPPIEAGSPQPNPEQLMQMVQQMVEQLNGQQMEQLGSVLRKEVIAPIEDQLKTLAGRQDQVEGVIRQIAQPPMP